MVLKSEEKKKDCESNAFKWLLPNIRREHPHFKICALMDGPRSKAQRARLLRELNTAFIMGAKRGDHKILQEQLDVDGETCEFATPDVTQHVFHWHNGTESDDSNRNLWADVLICRERIPERKVRKAGEKVRTAPPRERTFGWPANIELRPSRPVEAVRTRRARWKFENETFNNLKSLDNLEHSYGYGKNWLMLCCPVFRAARSAFHAR